VLPGELRAPSELYLPDGLLIAQNEDEVGQGIKDSGIKREDIFITSKV
jgi:diketogulonate reductase-like aldo/keto reductase